MFTDQALLVLIFKIINLGIMLILALQVYKYYLKPVLENLLQEQQTEYQRLQKAKIALDEQKHALDERAHIQQRMAQELSAKVQEWYTTVAQQNQLQKHKAYLLQQQMHAMHQEQQERMVFERTRKRVGMHVIHELEHDLVRTFAHTPKAQEYLHAVIESMEERV